MDEMPSAYGTLRTTASRIRHQVPHRAVQQSQLLQNVTILIVKSRSVLNAPPSMQVRSGARENALDESGSTLRAVCNVTGGIGTGRGVICHRGVSDGSDGASPHWPRHAAWTEMLFADVWYIDEI